VIDDVSDPEVVTKFVRPDLKFLNGLRGLQTLQQRL